MRVEILYDNPISPNLDAGDVDTVCAYPLSTVLDDGSIVCVYRQGTAKHSHDGILVMQKSEDRGASWSKPCTLVDGRFLNPPQTVEVGALCQTVDGTLMAIYNSIEGLRASVYMFSEEGRELPYGAYVIRSRDRGTTWSAPTLLNAQLPRKSGITTKPFVLRDGELCVPFEFQTLAGTLATGMVFSHDNGQTFSSPVIVAKDFTGCLNFCDARFDQLPDGRVLALLWTFRQENEETIVVHHCVSSDHGRSWTEPKSVGFVGQITVPLTLPGGEVIAAGNYRHPPDGIRLWYSPEGTKWEAQSPIQMWDAASGRILAEPAEMRQGNSPSEKVWDALPGFSFGTPDLLHLRDGSILMTYYATINHTIHVRSCRFRLQSQ